MHGRALRVCSTAVYQLVIMRRLFALTLLGAAALGLSACSGDGDVVLPSDTKPRPPVTTTARNTTCTDILATTTTTANATQLVICQEWP
jgi:hypothetical protein